MTVQNPYLDDTAQALRFWATKYKTRFNEDPAVFSAYGYLVIDSFIAVAQKAGPNLTTDTFIKAMRHCIHLFVIQQAYIAFPGARLRGIKPDSGLGTQQALPFAQKGSTNVTLSRKVCK